MQVVEFKGQPVNDTDVSVFRTGVVMVGTRRYTYERKGPGHYLLARTHASGRTEVQVRGTDALMQSDNPEVAGVLFHVRSGRLETAIPGGKAA